MPNKLFSLCASLLLVLVLASRDSETRAGAQPEPLALIMGSKSKVTSISAAELARVFRGLLTRNDDGDRFVPLNQPSGSPYRTLFDKVVLGMTPAESQAFWIDQKIRAAAPEPRTVSSVALAVKMVSAFPGAIAYVPVSAATSEVKILKLDGKLPGEPGYALR